MYEYFDNFGCQPSQKLMIRKVPQVKEKTTIIRHVLLFWLTPPITNVFIDLPCSNVSVYV